MARSFAVVCEAAADRETACGLADRVFCREVDWISEEVLDDYRQWRGLAENDSHLKWTDAAKLARQENIKLHGPFNDQPLVADELAARRAILLLKRSASQPDGVVLIRDDDRDKERRQGMERAREAIKLTVPIVIGLAHPKRECWILAGFEPCSADEQTVLDELRRQLGFDPRETAEELTAKHDHDLKSAKRVLKVLTGSGREREEKCWRETDLGLLERRGRNSGLADYLQEVLKHLVLLFK